ncbi:MAG TPA: hypothetical protein VMM36_13150 [Opitutaceae bacterium]|nr:hypothetical protein [Opitutaceae bacterium]
MFTEALKNKMPFWIGGPRCDTHRIIVNGDLDPVGQSSLCVEARQQNLRTITNDLAGERVRDSGAVDILRFE